MRLAPGTVVDGRWIVQECIGRGAMAVVYRARHERLGTSHALKVLELPSWSVRQRLMAEGRMQGQLRHPNVVPVTDVVEIEGCPALIMDLVRGPSLERLLTLGPLPLDVVRVLGVGLLEGVAAAHALGLVHRDLKPANVLLDAAEDRLVPRIADFGLAKVLRADSGQATATRSGTMLGTPAYMAPEQIRDARAVDARADVFSLGAVLYELVTGHRAFPGDDVLSIWDAIRAGRYTPPLELRPDAGPLAEAIRSALEVEPEARCPSVEALLAGWTSPDPAAARRCDWPAGLLRQARELGARPEAPPSLSSSGGATFDAVGSLVRPRPVEEPLVATVQLLPDDPVPRRSRWWWWAPLLAVGAVAVVCAGGGLVVGGASIGWYGRAATRSRHRTPVEAVQLPTPALGAVPGLAELLSGRPETALGALADLPESCPVPDACLVRGAAALAVGDPDGWRWVARVAAGPSSDPGDAAALARLVGGGGDPASFVGTPREPLARLLLGGVEGLEVGVRERLLRDGDAPALRLALADLLVDLARTDEAATVVQAVPEASRGAWWTVVAAERDLASGDAAAARALAELPIDARFEVRRQRLLAGAIRAMGDRAGLEASRPAADQDPALAAAYAWGHAEAALGLGALGEGSLAADGALSVAGAAPAVWLARARFEQVLVDESADPATAAALARGASAGVPEAAEPAGLTARAWFADGLVALASDDAGAFRTAVAGLEASGSPRWAGYLRDAAQARQGAPPSRPPPAACATRLAHGRWSARVSSPGAAAALAGLVDDPASPCGAFGLDRLARGEASARLAVLAWEAGDREEARRRLDDYGRWLPEADLQLPFYAAIEEVREGLDSEL